MPPCEQVPNNVLQWHLNFSLSPVGRKIAPLFKQLFLRLSFKRLHCCHLGKLLRWLWWRFCDHIYTDWISLYLTFHLLWLLFKKSLPFFFSCGHTCGMWELPDQRLNPCHSSSLSCAVTTPGPQPSVLQGNSHFHLFNVIWKLKFGRNLGMLKTASSQIPHTLQTSLNGLSSCRCI